MKDRPFQSLDFDGFRWIFHDFRWIWTIFDGLRPISLPERSSKSLSSCSEAGFQFSTELDRGHAGWGISRERPGLPAELCRASRSSFRAWKLRRRSKIGRKWRENRGNWPEIKSVGPFWPGDTPCLGVNMRSLDARSGIHCARSSLGSEIRCRQVRGEKALKQVDNIISWMSSKASEGSTFSK